VKVPFPFGLPSRRPDGRRVKPAGTWPDHLYGGVPPVALKVVVKKLFTNAFWPAPTSQTLWAQAKKRESIASEGFVPMPPPVSRTVR
jgi:hypothetical protein